MNRIADIKVEKVTNSHLHLGPVESACFLRDCSGCIVTVACSHFRAKNCQNLQVFLYCRSGPSIEFCDNLVFGPYNFMHPLQDSNIQAAGLDLSTNLWSEVFDFNAVEGETNWEIMQPQNFSEMNWVKEELGPPVNPIERYASYGGTLAENIAEGSNNMGTRDSHLSR